MRHQGVGQTVMDLKLVYKDKKQRVGVSLHSKDSRLRDGPNGDQEVVGPVIGRVSPGSFIRLSRDSEPLQSIGRVLVCSDPSSVR